jgi:hypothetical protein
MSIARWRPTKSSKASSDRQIGPPARRTTVVSPNGLFTERDRCEGRAPRGARHEDVEKGKRRNTLITAK